MKVNKWLVRNWHVGIKKYMTNGIFLHHKDVVNVYSI